jgi:N-acetylglucosamine kinase-like BadF-type ATPase
MFGDFGSGTDIAGEAVSAVAAQFTAQGPRTSLSERLCEATHTASPAEFLEGVARSNLLDPKFSRHVIAVADDGDPAARRILERAGTSLGYAAGHIARRLGMDETEFDLVLTGGMFRNDSRILTSALEFEVKRYARLARLARLEAPPVVGAVLLAHELLDEPADPDLHTRLAIAVNEALVKRVF